MMVKAAVLTLALVLGGVALAGAQTFGGVGETISFSTQDGKTLFTYKAGDFKPYIESLYSPAGVNVLRDSPSDHKHHHGLMFAVKADDVNFWEEVDGCGREVHRRFSKLQERGQALLDEELDWLSADGAQAMLTERRRIASTPLDGVNATVLTWTTTLSPPQGKEKATLTGAHYHGLGMRFVESMDGAGTFSNAAGEEGDVVRGSEHLTRTNWCAITGTAEGKPVTIAMFDAPGNPRGVWWFTMDKPFAYLSAALNLHREPLGVASDKPLAFRYGIALWDGHVGPQVIEAAYKAFVESLKEK